MTYVVLRRHIEYVLRALLRRDGFGDHGALWLRRLADRALAAEEYYVEEV
jgi:hypothetical protein